jgi:DNA-binding XRE family transcriptional regulator
MADMPVDPEADTFRGLALVLRARAVATQREEATHAGVSERAVGYWEAGLSHRVANLWRLIAFYLARRAFTPAARA